MVVLVLLPAATTCNLRETSGETAVTPSMFLTISMSSFFRVCAVPRPEETIPRPGWTIPGRIVKRFEPRPSILDWIATLAPLPIETIAITEAIPMTMPSIVKPDRALLADNALYVSFIMSIVFIVYYLYLLFCLQQVCHL